MTRRAGWPLPGAREGTVVWAREQTGGRGRRGRVWASPRGNLYSSTILRPDCPAARAAELGFAAGLAVADLVPAGREVRLKWPNDVLVDGGKVAGILAESSVGEGGRVDHVVLGIGVNVGFAPDLPEMRYPGARLGGTVRRRFDGSRPGLAHWLGVWRREGFEAVRGAWLAKAGPLGAPVDVRLGEELVSGRFAGLDRDGALLLDTDRGARRIVSGEMLGARLRGGRACCSPSTATTPTSSSASSTATGSSANGVSTPRPCAPPTSMPSWLFQLMEMEGIDPKSITDAIVGSVVPNANFNLRRLCSRYFNTEAMFLGDPGVVYGIEVKGVRAGADRICNSVGSGASCSPGCPPLSHRRFRHGHDLRRRRRGRRLLGRRHRARHQPVDGGAACTPRSCRASHPSAPGK